ncbi:MAG TPA: hypothetical protein EYM57_03160 [Gammaproteobacteria bacterium]|jgi:hypothetical protein|nr:MAG: hypothetical protein COA89_13750 [Acidithiobacillus sp.]HBK75919.1 hypothetical protein [Gammaproteobacteria bacterium]HIM96888.1 hypothetical protein [Gammaproteobacteria bacterium]
MMPDLVEESRKVITASSDHVDELDDLNEISIRTGAIGGFVLKSNQYGKVINQKVNVLKNTANNLSRSTTPEDDRKQISDAFSTIADLFNAEGKMLSYATWTAASAGVGADRTWKHLLKQKRNTKR